MVAATTRTSTLMSSDAADALHDVVLQESQQLRLERLGHVADLVQEDRPAVGRLELPVLLTDGAGEGALLVAEELALEEPLRNGGAVDGDEGFPRAAARPVDLPRYHVLAGAAFAEEQNRGVAVGHPVGHLEHVA